MPISKASLTDHRFMIPRRSILAIFLIAFALSASGEEAGTGRPVAGRFDNPVAPLSVRFSPGDDSGRTGPGHGGWLETGSPEFPFGGRGWYHLTFPPMEPQDDPAFFPGRIGNVYEVYCNGHRAGARGSVEPCIGLPWTSGLAVFPLEPSWLRSDAENIITIRVRNFFGPGGLLGPEPVIANTDTLRLEVTRAQRGPMLELFGLLVLLGLLLVASVILSLSRPGERFGWIFSGLVFCEFANHFVRARFLIWEIPVSESAQFFIAWLGTFVYPVLAVLVVRRLLMDRVTKGWRLFFLAMPPAGIAFTALAMREETEILAYAAGGAVFLTCIGSAVVTAVGAVRKRRPFAGFGLGAVVAAALSYVPEFLNFFGPFFSETNRWVPPSAWGFLAFASVFGVLALFHLDRHRQRANRLGDRIFAIREDERARFARDLHDGAARDLAALKLHIQLGQTADLGVTERERTVASLEKVSRELREAARASHPAILEKMPLRDAMSLFAEWAGAGGPELEMRLSAGLDTLGKSRALALYRLFQEALSNAIRHGKASRIRVTGEISQGEVILRIEDDGIGMDPDPQGEAQGLGMTSLRERADEAGGTIHWYPRTSGASTGTTVEVRLPARS